MWEQRQLTEQAQAPIENDERGANVPFVTVVGKHVHDNRSQNIGWGNKALGSRNVKPHAHVQNNRQEVGNGVGAGRGQAKEAGKAPDLQVQTVLEVLPDVEPMTCQRSVQPVEAVDVLCWDDIMPVFLDSRADEVRFSLVQELQAKGVDSLLGEVHNDEIGTECEDTSDDTF